MKKILLSLFALTFFGSLQFLKAQTVCTPGAPIKRWTGTGAAGDLAAGRAGNTGTNLFSIDGNNAEWVEHISGPLNPLYTTAPIPTYQPDPYSAPVAGGNVQVDGLRNIASPSVNYDRDRPGQDHRDLRYFAFTYDQANVYFLFRRPGNNNSQVSFYYFIDIDVDGFMKTGEPVAKVTYNGATASLEMYYYIENAASNSIAAGSWVSGKGNSMVATVARAGDANTSQWVVGSADGWSMPGSVAAPAPAQLPALGIVGGVAEVFSAAAMNTAGQVGFAAEFAIPWNYFRYYSGSGATGPTPQKILDYNKIFTWHVSLDNGNGNSNSNDDEDNAGGCCSGLAASGAAVIAVQPPSTLAAGSTFANNTLYTSKVKYVENAGAGTTIFMGVVEFSNITINPLYTPDPTAFSVIVYKDADNNGVADDAGTTYLYNASLSTPPTMYAYQASPASSMTVSPGGNVSFITKIDMITRGVKSFTLTTRTNNEIVNTGTATCGQPNTTTSTQDQLTITTPLPVDFKSFTASRNRSNVLLKWETMTERNSEGFAVDRNVGGTWEQIAFIPSRAQGGSSDALLAYTYIDLNQYKGISQYRIRQVDFDSRSKYTDIRSVRGEGQTGKTIVYPNPTNDGRVSVVFEETNVSRNISVMDMSGRIIKEWRSITNNNLTIDNLNAGMYSLRIVAVETGEQSVQKIVVNKR